MGCQTELKVGKKNLDRFSLVKITCRIKTVKLNSLRDYQDNYTIIFIMEWHQLRRADFDYWTRMSSRWRDMDALGHINHAAYLTYMESSRVDVYYELGYGGIRKEEQESTILGAMEVNYHHQATHPIKLEIGHRISRVGGKSFDFIAGIFKKGQEPPICTALFKMVAFNYYQNQAISVPTKIKELCRPIVL